MDAKLLKLSAHLIAPSLTDIYNLSLSTRVIPNEWKLARIAPIYKGKGDISRECNYRPISVLSRIAKLFEKRVCMQLLDYLESNDMITPLQSAYLKKHSTVTCLHKVVDDFCEMIDDGDMCGICFLDIEKCFDTIHHGILLQKLEYYGIQGYALQWFKQYLTNITQYVRLGNYVFIFERLPLKMDFMYFVYFMCVEIICVHRATWENSQWLNVLPCINILEKNKKHATANVLRPIYIFDSLGPRRCECNPQLVISKQISRMNVWSISCEIALIWMSKDLGDNQPKLVQGMMSQWWHRSLSLCGSTRPKWVTQYAVSTLAELLLKLGM